MARRNSNQENEQENTEMNNNELPENEKENTNTETENVSEENVETTETNNDTTFKVGDRVKVDKLLSSDILGRRIHNGLKNYVYTIKVVRPDGIAHIECMTYEFDVHTHNLTKM